jgi:hypothetical protein
LFRKRSRTKRLILTVGVALVASSSAYAYTASVNVPNSQAGYGTGAVNNSIGVSSAQFSLDTTGNPRNVTQVTFGVTPTSVQSADAEIVQGGTTYGWYGCSVASGSVTCNTTSPQASLGAWATGQPSYQLVVAAAD